MALIDEASGNSLTSSSPGGDAWSPGSPGFTDLGPFLDSLPAQFIHIWSEGEELASRDGWNVEQGREDIQCGDTWLPPLCSCLEGNELKYIFGM